MWYNCTEGDIMTDKHSFRAEQTDTVSLAVYNVGYEKCAGLHKWGIGVRDHYLIHHIISGKGEYHIGKSTFYLKSGDTFIVYPFTEISYIADKNEPWEYYWTGFNGTDAEHLTERAGFSRDNPVISADFGCELKNSLEKIYNFSGKTSADMVKMTGQLYITLGIMIDVAKKDFYVKNVSQTYVDKAIRFFSFNYALDISIEQTAEYAGVSRATLYRAFMETEKISPISYLTNFRVKQALRLLHDTSLPVSAVARSVGFEDALYFSRVFSRSQGQSPSEYRKSVKATLGKN